MSNLCMQQLEALSKIGPVRIAYSGTTKKFYLEIDGIWEQNGVVVKGFSEHKDSVEEAVDDFCRQLVKKDVILDLPGADRVQIIGIPIRF